MASLLFGNKAKGEIGELKLDVTSSENHISRNEVTQYPVENGFDISDHIIQRPDEISISAIISNTPVGLLQARAGEVFNLLKGQSVSYKNLINGQGGGKAQIARDILYRISGRVIHKELGTQRVKPELVTLVTGLRVYNDMAITELNFPRDASTGDALRFSATFKKVIKVDTESVKIPNPSADSKDKTKSTVDKKQQATTVPKPKQKSLVFTVGKAIKGLF